ncbi:adenylyltransferase/cytidyltransferase family protein [Synergistaceae bacterium OttesenSCG-928-I11]|nr:adenylyltransferase/cytidyltransferase family protein [Synergistaceae bacterium OttesenSCG-928-I11]
MKLRSEYFEIIYKWLRYKDHIDLSVLLRNFSFNNVAIYGGGILGELLYEYLVTVGFSVPCVIDRNVKLNFPYDVDVLTPNLFLDSGQNRVDAVIVTVLDYHYYRIREALLKNIDCAILPLSNLIDIDVLQELFTATKHIEESKAHLFIMNIFQPIQHIKEPSPMELNHLAHRTFYSNYYDPFTGEVSSNFIKFLLNYYDDLPQCSEEYVKEVFCTNWGLPINKNGIISLQDVRSKYFNVIDGVRHTFGTPKTHDNTIHFFGHCLCGDILAEDCNTIESKLQHILNASPLLGKTYRVLNHANWRTSLDSLKQISQKEFSAGDIAILMTYNEETLEYYVSSNAVHFHDLSNVFDRPHDMGEIFFDQHHINHRGYQLIANRIYEILAEHQDRGTLDKAHKAMQNAVLNNFTPRKTFTPPMNVTTSKPSLEGYLSFLEGEKADCSGVIGAIVMNCNPFTLGHQFLIEEAKKQCSFLYVFVVEEDRSFFPFSDRLMLVKAGTSEFDNIKVLPGGHFMISTLTFPEYFEKESVKDVKIDASKDIKIFAEKIAPMLNITKRFVGEEPLDPITNQYNQAMIEYLPRYGVAVVEIPRMRFGGYPISASFVRELFKSRSFNEISKIVPPSTLDYLENR